MARLLKVNRKFEAYLDRMNEIVILLPKEMQHDRKSFFIEHANGNHPLDIIDVLDIGSHIKYSCQHQLEIEFGKTVMIVDENGVTTDLQIGAVIRTNEFDQMFRYDGDDLGVTYKKEQSLWKVWAPTATAVNMKLYRQDKQQVAVYEMERQENGVWSLTLQGDFEGFLYTFLACVNLVWKEAVDPYAIAVSINGEYGVIVNKEKIAVSSKKLPPFQNKNDAIIYEAHIRDFSSHHDSGMTQKGKYVAWLETDTNNKASDSTGITYLKELGVTHVELLPINDYEEVDEYHPNDRYNWGYNPLHFFAPEGSYSLNPENTTERIREVKALIQSLHNHEIRVILDVVYNHVYSKENSSFEKLVPGYFFRYDENGNASNGTGVGNDLASERFMVRKFIIDCASYWMEEYDIDGFRFDLMGILDVDTMSELKDKIYALKPDSILLGEGWDLNTPLPIHQKVITQNAKMLPSISFFNDQFRDVVKGSTFNLYEAGFVHGHEGVIEQMKQLVSGSPSRFIEPIQSINYVESHDNHTMWDRFLIYSEQESDDIRMARHRLATSIVLLSQGIPFLHAGQEFFRTKQRVENSYNSPDEINWINWSDRSRYKENVEYVKGLIQIRKMHGAFRLPNFELIGKHLTFIDAQQNFLTYQLKDVGEFGPWSQIIVVHHNKNSHEFKVHLPTEKWYSMITPDTIHLTSPIAVENDVAINKIGTYVFCKI